MKQVLGALALIALLLGYLVIGLYIKVSVFRELHPGKPLYMMFFK